MQKMHKSRRVEVPGKDRSKQLNAGSPPGWSRSTPVETTESMQPPTDAVVCAIISTWYEADIIAASVKSCFDNGCSRVLILDNNSPDDTVAVAVAAGAEVGEVYATDFYDDDLRIRKQNELAQKLVEQTKAADMWIITLDADEFMAGTRGEPVATTLRRMPANVRTVGSTCVDLYPDSPDAYVRGEHPAKYMTYGLHRFTRVYCGRHHWKHVALRYHNGVFDIAQHRGNHWCAAASKHTTVHEPFDFDLRMFHAPLRNRSDAEARLQTLCGKSSTLGGLRRSAGDDEVTGNNGSIKKWRSLDDIYNKRWDRVEYPHSQLFGRDVVGIALYRWDKIFPELAGMFNNNVAPSGLLNILGE
jgi:hypothetical protein